MPWSSIRFLWSCRPVCARCVNAGRARYGVEGVTGCEYDKFDASDVVDAAWHELPGQLAPPVVGPTLGVAVRFSPSDASFVTAPIPLYRSPGPAMASSPSELTSHLISAQLADTPNNLDTSDRTIEMLFVMASPRVVLFGNVLSDSECDLLIEQSRNKLRRSGVINAITGALDVGPYRTSSGTHFKRGENELITRIERRIAELVDYPVHHGEPIQVLHYQPGGEYKPHYDYFDPAHQGHHQVLTQGGQRVATLIMYLSNVDVGGSTLFPQIGLGVLPRKGHAVYFAYCDEDGALDARTLHGGSPVSAGEKWIATKWFRQRAHSAQGNSQQLGTT